MPDPNSSSSPLETFLNWLFASHALKQASQTGQTGQPTPASNAPAQDTSGLQKAVDEYMRQKAAQNSAINNMTATPAAMPKKTGNSR